MPKQSTKDDRLTITIDETNMLNNHTIQISKGASLREISKNVVTPDYLPILAARVNNKLVHLDFIPDKNSKVEFIHFNSHGGQEVYRRSACLILVRAVLEMHMNTRLVIGHSIAKGYYYDFFTDTPVNESVLREISKRMKELVELDLPIKRSLVTRDEAIEIFMKEGQPDKLRLLKHIQKDKISLYRVGDFPFSDIEHVPLAPSTGCIRYFELRRHSPGFILRFPTSSNPKEIPAFCIQERLSAVYRESKEWAKVLEVNTVGRFNEYATERYKISEFIKIQEALHEKKISSIADEIASNKKVRLVMIAGPSSSGKTTTSKRLAIHLKVNGLKPVALSLDDYFVNREFCPRDEHGDYDFESIEALDVPFFNEHLVKLLQGQEVTIPRFCFENGKRKSEGHPLTLDEDHILIVEGIHGMNEKLTASVSSDQKFKLYVSALTQIAIDDHNRVRTTDVRLIRRIVRDAKFRNYSALETISRWPSVRRGEETWIFPFQEKADIMFNSALTYELSVLRPHVEPLLKAIPESCPEYTEAQRLLGFLSCFVPIAPEMIEEIPPTSILREFIGNSSFHY